MPTLILLTDATCNLCNRSVRFILEHERDQALRFASLQSAFAQALLADLNTKIPDLTTLVLIEHTTVHTKSAAVLRILPHLRAPWRWLIILALIPRPLRDWLYTRIARNRHRLFATSENCPTPTPAQSARFLDADERAQTRL